ncbi:MAG: MG2 domain-containing protein [Acidobacteriota bacterium]
MRRILVLSFLGSLLLSIAGAQPQGASPYVRLKADAEREYAEKSFLRAHEVYEQAAKLELTPEDRRWVEFRLAETTLRADVANPDNDPSARTAARAALEQLIAKSPDDEMRAEMNEALGDLFFTHPYERNQGAAQQRYAAALEFWAGSSDLPRARRRYLDIVWKLAEQNEGWYVPRAALVNAVTLAETPEERAHARYLLAQQYLREGNPQSIERGMELLPEVIAIGKKSEYYDDALYLYAVSLANGRDFVSGVGEDEQPTANYTKALEFYRRILTELEPEETRYYDTAKQAVAAIIGPAVGVQAGGTFLPQSEQDLVLSWRNVKRIELALVSVDLTKDGRYDERQEWTSQIVTAGRKVVRSWAFETNDTGEHRPGSTRLRLEPRLAPGAYILTAGAGGEKARQLVLVTDAHILVHSGNQRMDVYVSDVVTGEPIANARVHIWQRNGGNLVERDALTNAEGLARIVAGDRSGYMLITASAGARQAYLQGYSYSRHGDANPEWRIYAFTDRPAYRPLETVQWKVLARVRQNESWQTPDGAALDYEITSPRGEKVASGVAKLNAFGSFWGELPLTEAMALGQYVITFKSKNDFRGSAVLFRLEEYKLPEFLVRVVTPEEKQYRLGDTIEATIEATYYFGGPVANATVEAVTYQQPFSQTWYPWREYAWYFPTPPSYDNGTVVRRDTLRTDAEGRAVLRIDTPRDGTDMTYRIEARVVDASRREVRGEGTVRVMRQRYSVMARPEHSVYRPGDSVSVKLHAQDANDKPVEVTGTVKVVRRRWREADPPIPAGVVRKNSGRIRPARYEDEEVLTTKVTTAASGDATFTFTPKSTGYYLVRWTSTDGPKARDVVTTETALWVADKATMDLGYHVGGLDLILDKETMRAGETASILVVTPASGRWIVLTSAADDIVDTQVLHLDGTVKLVQLPLDARHVPNFYITASSVFDRQLSTDSERIVVPPVEQFLQVEVKTDREQYEPRQEGTVTVTTRDSSGKPVRAEVGLAVSDEAVTAIQADLAGDPRPFFYGETRENPLQISAGLQGQQYLLIEDQPLDGPAEVPGSEGDSGYYGLAKDQRQMGVVGGVAGGMVGARMAESMAMDSPPAPPAPAMAPQMKSRAERSNAVADAVMNQAAPQQIDVQVRSDFRSTAFWKPDVVTGADGTATVKVKYPEALTTWRATARAATASSQFGMATATARTNMPLLVRLQGPRFFVAGDRVVVSAVMNNNTDQVLSVTPSLEVEGLTLTPSASKAVQVPAHGEARADWTVVAEKAGPAKLRVTARSAQYGDAMERPFVVYEHGIDKLIAHSGKLRGSEALIRLDLPRERRATDLTVQVAPSLAVTMLDALPYLIQYPYGCTEQTMSRFLPAAIVARTLEKLKLGRARVAGKELDAVTAAGLARLYDMQHGDGGWGWWKEGDSDAFMTAYVVWGMAVAREGGLRVDEGRAEPGAAWLDQHLVQYEKAYSDQAWMLHALSAWRKTPSAAGRRAFDDVWTNREKLTSYSRALLALTAHRWNDVERARVLVRNLEDGVKIDRAPDQSVLLKGETTAETMATAHWGTTGFWWRWHDSPVESTAFVLQALSTIDPSHRLIEPAMNWLVKNRRGAQWNNTRDTAIALLALNDYLQHSGELAGGVSYEVSVNGKVIATKTLTATDVLGAPSRFPVDASILTDTMQEVRIRRTAGTSPLYFSAEARFVSLEEPVKAAGNEIFVRREYFRLAPRPTLLKGVQYDRVPLRDHDAIRSGERVEVVVTIESKNDYSYLLFEDLKPGGFEAVELQSGQPLFALSPKTGQSAWVYQELRDRKVALFIDHLNQGVWEIKYTLRAEVPGSFHALPLLGEAMYVPDIRANSDEIRVEVRE